MLALPAAFKVTVAFLHTTVGAVLSTTVTVAEQVLVLPLPSLAVSVTLFVPMLLQVNVFGITDTRFTVPQLSVPLWNTAAVVTLAFPAPLMVTVAGLQIILGAVWSTTVTVKEQVPLLPAASVAVRVTTCVPVTLAPATGFCVLAGLAVQLSAALAEPA